MNGPPEHRTVQTVVYFIGAVAVILTLGDITLVAIVLASGRDVSPAAVALIATVSGLAGTSIGSLASLLVSTKPAPAPGDPSTFTVAPDATVKVEPTAPEEPSPPDPRPVKPSPTEPTSARKSTAARRRR